MVHLAPTNKEFLQEKFFSFPVTLLFIVLLSPASVGDAYLILGHAHFMMTALYQYKMGRVTSKSFIFYLGAFAALFYIAHLFPKEFTLFAATFLLFHVYMGEARHIKKNFSPTYLCLTLALATILSSWLIMELWQVVLPMTVIVLFAAGLGLLGLFFHIKNEGYNFELLLFTLLALLAIFTTLELVGMRPVSLESFGFIVIAHYMATYFNVFRSFTRKGEGKQWPFVWESVAMNLLFVVGYIAVFYYLGTDNVLYDYVYQPISFYVWTVMHFLTTMNLKKYKEDLMGLLVRRKS